MPQGILSSAMDDISKHLILCVGLVSYFYDHHNHSRNQSLKLIKSSIKYQLGLLCRLASTLEFWNYQVLKHCDNFLYHRNMTANKIQLFILGQSLSQFCLKCQWFFFRIYRFQKLPSVRPRSNLILSSELSKKAEILVNWMASKTPRHI